jgi:glucose/mannose-6-phosphate isomerase
MDLNQHTHFHTIDPDDMYGAILALPDQLKAGYDLGTQLPLPEMDGLRAVVIAGMGGSAIAADMLVGCYSEALPLPVSVIRDYRLPNWVNGDEYLVVCSSHSGNTEETLSVFAQARERGCRTVAITTGGKLSEQAAHAGLPLWQFTHTGQPRAAVGWSSGFLLALFHRLGLLADQHEAVAQAAAAMDALIEKNSADIPTAQNPAKRYAGQLVGKYVAVFGAEHLAPVARRWKTQINELAKSWCQYEELPEANHNTLAGTLFPEEQLLRIFSIFLQSPHYLARNQQRVDLTFTELMVAGIGTDKVGLRGETPFSDMWLTLLFGDLISYYLAILLNIDPTPVEAIEAFKAQLE